MAQKPFMGVIVDWHKAYEIYGVKVEGGLGYVIVGRNDRYEDSAENSLRTSFVVAHDSQTGVIETNNSIYYLKGAEQ